MAAIALTEREVAMLRAVFARHAKVTGVTLFGSRATGTAGPASDVDLALHGALDALDASRVAGDLAELSLPYRFDVVGLAALRSQKLLDAIAAPGVTIYQRGETR